MVVAAHEQHPPGPRDGAHRGRAVHRIVGGEVPDGPARERQGEDRAIVTGLVDAAEGDRRRGVEAALVTGVPRPPRIAVDRRDRVYPPPVVADVEDPVVIRGARLDRRPQLGLPVDLAAAGVQRPQGPAVGAEVDPVPDRHRGGLEVTRGLEGPSPLPGARVEGDEASPELGQEHRSVGIRGPGHVLTEIALPTNLAPGRVQGVDLPRLVDHEHAVAGQGGGKLDQLVGEEHPGVREWGIGRLGDVLGALGDTAEVGPIDASGARPLGGRGVRARAAIGSPAARSRDRDREGHQA